VFIEGSLKWSELTNHTTIDSGTDHNCAIGGKFHIAKTIAIHRKLNELSLRILLLFLHEREWA